MTLEARDVLLAAIGLFALFNALLIGTMVLNWTERKFLGRLQGRVGPTRVGPFGLLQPLADAMKLVLKEDVSPGPAARAIFWVSPILIFVPAYVVWLAVPVAPGLVIRALDLGIFFFIAFSVLSIVGLVLAGWSSASKYAVLGSFRSAAQLVSYEIPIIMALLAVVVATGTMNIGEVVEQQGSAPLVAILPLAFVVFLIAGVAEVGRTPFDIYFAESEVVGGPFVEYSGAHWAIFFLAEYISTLLIAVLAALLFLGGWRWPFGDGLPGAAAAALVMGKAYLVVLAIFWVRATYPRLRIDQLMSFGWKVLVPLSFAAVIISAAQQFYGWHPATSTVLSLAVLAVPVAVQARYQRRPALERARRYAERAIANRQATSVGG